MNQKFTDLEIKFLKKAIDDGKEAEDIYLTFPFTIKKRTLAGIKEKIKILKK